MAYYYSGVLRTSTAGGEAIQIAKLKGATVISTTRSEKNKPILLERGADNIYVDTVGYIESYLREITNGVGIHASFDPVGGNFINALSKGGTLMLYGGLSGTYSNPPFLAMIQNNLWFHAYSLFNYVEDADVCARGLEYVYEGLADGSLVPDVDKVFPMSGYIDAWTYLKGERSSYGKVVVETGATNF